MAKRNMFKQTSTVHLENTGTSGNWNSFMDIVKQQDQFKSAYVDKVRISFVMHDQRSSAGIPEPSQFGVLFAAATSSALDSSTPSNNDTRIISAGSSGTATCKPVTLWLKRRIVVNEVDQDSGQGVVRLFCRTTDPVSSSNVQLYCIVETWGRWHDTQAL